MGHRLIAHARAAARPYWHTLQTPVEPRNRNTRQLLQSPLAISRVHSSRSEQIPSLEPVARYAIAQSRQPPSLPIETSRRHRRHNPRAFLFLNWRHAAQHPPTNRPQARHSEQVDEAFLLARL